MGIASNASGSDYFGYAVAISGNLVLASAYADGTGGANGIFPPAGKPTPNTLALNSGAVYAYSYSPSTSTTGWSEEVYIKASNNAAGNNFGSAIAFDGFTAVIGAENESSNANSITNVGTGPSFPTTATGTTNSGSAYIYYRDGNGAWSQQAYVKPTNNNPYNNFGNTIAISQDTVVIGAPYEKSVQKNLTNGPSASSDVSGTIVGAAYIFKKSATTNQWAQKAYLKSDNSHDNDMFGAGLAILDDSVFVGAPYQATSSSTDTTYLTPQAGAIYYMRLNKGPIP